MSRQVFVYGDYVDTDRIIPGKYTKTVDENELAAHVFEDLDPDFRRLAQPGAIVVAGAQFGVGSSREQAAIAIKAAKVSLVVARSFARVFFRNAINIGLPLMEIPEHTITTQSRLDFDLVRGVLLDRVQNKSYQAAPVPPLLAEIIQAGGLAAYIKEHGGYPGLQGNL